MLSLRGEKSAALPLLKVSDFARGAAVTSLELVGFPHDDWRVLRSVAAITGPSDRLAMSRLTGGGPEITGMALPANLPRLATP